MARFNANNNLDNYGGQEGRTGFFTLKNDGDVARVRFMYNTVEDIEGVSVHSVEIDEKKRYVNCLREYNEPLSVCPFCREHMSVQVKIFVPIYDVDDDKVKIWERGKKFFNKLSGLCSRYKRLVEKEFEIERHGKPGDQATTYEIFPVDDCEKLTLEDLPEFPENRLLLEKSAEDMEYFIDEGEFPPEDHEDTPRRRGDKNNETEERSTRGNDRRRQNDDDEDEMPFGREDGSSRKTGRRTPASSARRRGSEDSF